MSVAAPLNTTKRSSVAATQPLAGGHANAQLLNSESEGDNKWLHRALTLRLGHNTDSESDVDSTLVFFPQRNPAAGGSFGKDGACGSGSAPQPLAGGLANAPMMDWESEGDNKWLHNALTLQLVHDTD